MPRFLCLQSWVLASLAAVALVLTTGSVASALSAVSAAQSTGPAPSAGQQGRALPGPRVVDTHHAGASARRASYAWTGRTIRYYETIPAKWDWSLSTAVGKWNGAGGGIRFQRTTSRSMAQVTIGYGSTGPAAALATVGRTRHAYVRLSRSYEKVDALDAFYRIQVLGVFTHELGHVLGFGHTSTRCSLMSRVLDVAGCGMLPTSMQGYYTCRMIDAPLAARFVRLYGGHVRQPGSWCLIDRLPGELVDVDFEGDPTAVVTAHWTRPSDVPAGSHVVVRSWAAQECGTAPPDAATEYLPASAGTWEGSPAATPVRNVCVSLSLVNRYGAGGAPVLGSVPGSVVGP